MKILYFHQHFCTPKGSGGIRSYEFAKRWAAAGHDVTVVAGKGYDDSLISGRQKIAGFTVKCLGVKYRGTYNFTARLRSFLAFALKAALIAATARKYDIVLATSTPLTIAIPALTAKFIARRPVIFEVRDVWPDAAIDAGLLKNRLLIWIARTIEDAASKYCDHVVPLSTGMQQRIERKGVNPEKMTMLPNCSDLAHFTPDNINRQQARKQLHANGQFIVLYVGTINLANDMPFLAEAIKLTKDENLQWWFVGSGSRFDYLKEQIQTANAQNVVLWNKQPKSEVPKFINAADVGVVSFINKPVYYENSPNKFFDYCAGGLPVIFTRTTWLEPYIKQYQAGFICKNNSPGEFLQYLNLLRTNEKRRHTMGINARRLAEDNFSRDDIAAKYLELLTKLEKTKSKKHRVAK